MSRNCKNSKTENQRTNPFQEMKSYPSNFKHLQKKYCKLGLNCKLLNMNYTNQHVVFMTLHVFSFLTFFWPPLLRPFSMNNFLHDVVTENLFKKRCPLEDFCLIQQGWIYGQILWLGCRSVFFLKKITFSK